MARDGGYQPHTGSRQDASLPVGALSNANAPGVGVGASKPPSPFNFNLAIAELQAELEPTPGQDIPGPPPPPTEPGPRLPDREEAPRPARSQTPAPALDIRGLLRTVGVSLLFGLLGGWIYVTIQGGGARKSADATNVDGPANPVTSVKVTSDAGSMPVEATARKDGQASDTAPTHGVSEEEVDALKEQLDRLTERLVGFDKRVAAISQPGPAPDLAPLQAEIASLSKSTSGYAPLTDRVKQIDDRIAKLAASVTTFHNEMASLQQKADQVEKSNKAALAAAAAASPAREVRVEPAVPVVTPLNEKRPEPMPAPAPAPSTEKRPESVAVVPVPEIVPRPLETKPDGPVETADENQKALARGLELYKQGKYKEALGLFNRLELTLPDDARVWYFAALCHGFATSQWGGGTERLVERGLERERAGTPERPVIDAALGDLTPMTGKDWIAAIRKRGKAE